MRLLRCMPGAAMAKADFTRVDVYVARSGRTPTRPPPQRLTVLPVARHGRLTTSTPRDARARSAPPPSHSISSTES
jgi:hypothetical protein